jgi:hypothetical protein
MKEIKKQKYHLDNIHDVYKQIKSAKNQHEDEIF